MLWVRSIIFNILFYTNLIGLMLFSLPRLWGDRHKVLDLARLWAQTSLWLLERICGIRVEFRGLENIPQGACIIASKHESTLETFALTLHAPDFTFVLKRELLSIPFFGWYLRRAEQLGIDRSKGSQALADITREASRILAGGRQIFYFPEGTRRAVGAPLAYRSGVAHVYVTTGAVCVPVALNSGLFWPRRGLLRRPGTVVIAFLKPIQPGLDKQAFMRLLEQRIETASAELVTEAVANDPSLTANLMPDGNLPAI
jgi:1-acyl-sn-glycerol-3-phosphate acyltransferase